VCKNQGKTLPEYFKKIFKPYDNQKCSIEHKNTVMLSYAGNTCDAYNAGDLLISMQR